MSLGDEPGLIDAVRSVASSSSAEILVVNSGGGRPLARLEEAGFRVPVVSVDRRLSPGAARNIGLHETRAPIVAFLAADCVAGEGWIERRLRRHRDSDAVASAIEPYGRPNLVARAYHMYRFGRRLAETPEESRQLYGVSYRRVLFERYGLFREDVWVGEDTEFNERIGERPITWAPEVVTYHRHPRSIASAGIELFRRARKRKAFRIARGESLRRIRRGPLYVMRHARSVSAQARLAPAERAAVNALFVVFFLCQTAGVLAAPAPER